MKRYNIALIFGPTLIFNIYIASDVDEWTTKAGSTLPETNSKHP